MKQIIAKGEIIHRAKTWQEIKGYLIGRNIGAAFIVCEVTGEKYNVIVNVRDIDARMRKAKA